MRNEARGDPQPEFEWHICGDGCRCGPQESWRDEKDLIWGAVGIIASLVSIAAIGLGMAGLAALGALLAGLAFRKAEDA